MLKARTVFWTYSTGLDINMKLFGGRYDFFERLVQMKFCCLQKHCHLMCASTVRLPVALAGNMLDVSLLKAFSTLSPTEMSCCPKTPRGVS